MTGQTEVLLKYNSYLEGGEKHASVEDAQKISWIAQMPSQRSRSQPATAKVLLGIKLSS